jgi:Holliday junction resolvase RusA-like endonuclease
MSNQALQLPIDSQPHCLLKLTVFGTPEAAGSKRAFGWQAKDGRSGTNVVDANPRAAGWKKQVAQHAGEAMEGRELLEGPLKVRLTFYRKRPAGHYGSGRNAHVLKPSAAPYPTSKPDALKLARGVEDALTGAIYRDDSQIVTELLEKRYGTPERVEIEVFRA